jgi:DNA (cytosine-5)-methyltransferase 1
VRRPRLLDLYCGQGGASVGYYLAGFNVIGVDLKPQVNYPFPFIQRDSRGALLDLDILDEVDVVHASPPGHDLLRDTATLLKGLTGIPWILEGSGRTTLCGTHFRLGAPGHVLGRHRRFSASFSLPAPGPCTCSRQGVVSKLDPTEQRMALGIDWMSARGLACAVPPDYTRWIAEHLVRMYFPRVTARDYLHDRYSSGRIEQTTKR